MKSLEKFRKVPNKLRKIWKGYERIPRRKLIFKNFLISGKNTKSFEISRNVIKSIDWSRKSSERLRKILQGSEKIKSKP